MKNTTQCTSTIAPKKMKYIGIYLKTYRQTLYTELYEMQNKEIKEGK